jgi:hypothetical protein
VEAPWPHDLEVRHANSRRGFPSAAFFIITSVSFRTSIMLKVIGVTFPLALNPL